MSEPTQPAEQERDFEDAPVGTEDQADETDAEAGQPVDEPVDEQAQDGRR